MRFHNSDNSETDSGLLLLLLSCFSRVWLCATPEMAGHQAPLSLGFSRQEHWSWLPFPSPMHESEKWKGSHSVCPTLSNPMDCSPPRSSIHGIFQARALEWGAIAFSTGKPYSRALNTKAMSVVTLCLSIWCSRTFWQISITLRIKSKTFVKDLNTCIKGYFPGLTSYPPLLCWHCLTPVP